MTIRPLLLVLLVSNVSVAGCQRAPASGPPANASGPGGLSTRNMPAVVGQAKTCAGPKEKTFDVDVVETDGVELGMGLTFAAWAYNGHLPGPTIEACEGDTVTIRVRNTGTTSHGLDSHALKVDARHYGPTPPGTTLTLTSLVDTPGVFMYHCAAGPVTDIHIKSGLHGAMIVYPRRETLRVAREIVVVEDAVYGTQDASGRIPGTDPARTAKNDPFLVMFNGRLDNEPVRVAPGELVRMYFVNVGPGVSSAHIIGSLFDRVYAGTPRVDNVQTVAVPAGSGAMLEFRVPEAGVYPFVDHDKLAFLPYGLALAFATDGVEGAAH